MKLFRVGSKGKNRVLKQGIIVLVFILSMSSLCFGFSDVDESHRAFNDIKILTDAGYLSGYKDGTFRPEGTITRAEFVRITNQVLGYSGQSVSGFFPDVSEDDWYYQDVMTAVKEGYIIGYTDGTFRPDGKITREEVCVIIDKIIKNNQEMPITYMETIKITDRISSWAKESVSRVIASGLMSLDEKGMFRATEQAKRAEVCSAFSVLLQKVIANDDLQNPGKDGSLQDINIGPQIKVALNNIVSVMNNKILTDSVLTDNQKELIQTMSEALDDYLNSGDENQLSNAANNIKKEYNLLSDTDKNAIQTEIIKKVPIEDLLLLKEYFF